MRDGNQLETADHFVFSNIEEIYCSLDILLRISTIHIILLSGVMVVKCGHDIVTNKSAIMKLALQLFSYEKIVTETDNAFFPYCFMCVMIYHTTWIYIYRPPKVWHHLEHKRHARVLIPTLEYLLSMIITNWDYSVIISSYMYMNCVFDANLNDNKWVYVLQGHFLNWMKIIVNITKIDSLHSWP